MHWQNLGKGVPVVYFKMLLKYGIARGNVTNPVFAPQTKDLQVYKHTRMGVYIYTVWVCTDICTV